MIGDLHLYKDGETMIEVNETGTLEKLHPISSFWQLILYIKHKFKNMSLVEIRYFCQKHGRKN